MFNDLEGTEPGRWARELAGFEAWGLLGSGPTTTTSSSRRSSPQRRTRAPVRTLRSTLTKEVAALTGVTVLTALLVRASATL